ncbi:MAG: transposase [Actinobacteria bacterium]|nr:transposase [Actinomycetota bacterium]
MILRLPWKTRRCLLRVRWNPLWTRSNAARIRFSSNRVRLALFVLAYNLGNFLRRFALPKEVSHWSLTSIQLKLIKIGAKIISHSRMTVFQLCEASHNWNNVECSLMLSPLHFYLNTGL